MKLHSKRNIHALRIREINKQNKEGRLMAGYTEGEIATIRKVAKDKKLLWLGRKAVEDRLVDWRDSRLSLLRRGNGLVIREKDGSESSIIRMGTENAIKIGLEAMAIALSKAGVR